MKLLGLCCVLSLAAMTACASVSDDRTAAVLRELAPTGKLRVGVVVAPITTPFFVTKDPATGQLRGAAVDLGAELARKLGVPFEQVAYPVGEGLLEGANAGMWDVAFMPVDRERAKVVDFGPAYFLFESTYLVPSGSSIRSIADVDRPGVRVVALPKSTQAVHLSKSLTRATLLVGTVEEQIAMLRSGKADAITSGRPGLTKLAATLPGARVLDGSFASSSIAVAVPKNRPAALAYVGDFVEAAKASGAVRRAFDNAGLKDFTVAPAGAR
jgi:polar amino acid transport system substrate-binding protein